MTVSLDAWGGPWWSSPHPLTDLLANADVLFANEAEAAAMSGKTRSSAPSSGWRRTASAW